MAMSQESKLYTVDGKLLLRKRHSYNPSRRPAFHSPTRGYVCKIISIYGSYKNNFNNTFT